MNGPGQIGIVRVPIGMVIRPQLDSHSPVPLYRQVYEEIRSRIRDGRLAEGSRLPATRELAGQLGVNRATISAAYELLESEGYLKGHVGRGSFVSAGPVGARAAEEVGPISFATSRPSAQLFPLGEFQEACQEVLQGGQLPAILQLGSPTGYAPLRDYLLRETNCDRSGDDILITSGCQQAIDLLQRHFVGSGDSVLVEEPVYPGLKRAFERAGVRLLGAPVSSSGLDVAAWRAALLRERPRLAIVTPNFQNPTGTTLSLDARRELLRAASETDVTLVENDLYGPLRYHGESLPTLKDLDPAGRIVVIRSFSKIAFPGLRVGWVQASPQLVERLAGIKQYTDLHTDQLSQAVLLRFAESGRLKAHVDRMLDAGRERLAAVLSACQRHLPAAAEFTKPQGGMNLWLKLPAPLDAEALLPEARRRGVEYLPGRYFSVSHPDPGGLRLSFAGLSPQRIEAGLSLLGALFAEEQGRQTVYSRHEAAMAIV